MAAIVVPRYFVRTIIFSEKSVLLLLCLELDALAVGSFFFSEAGGGGGGGGGATLIGLHDGGRTEGGLTEGGRTDGGPNVIRCDAGGGGGRGGGGGGGMIAVGALLPGGFEDPTFCCG